MQPVVNHQKLTEPTHFSEKLHKVVATKYKCKLGDQHDILNETTMGDETKCRLRKLGDQQDS